MEPLIVHQEMPAWVAEHLGALQEIAQLYTSEGGHLSSSGDTARAQEAYAEAFRLGMDIVAIEREWTLPAD